MEPIGDSNFAFSTSLVRHCPILLEHSKEIRLIESCLFQIGSTYKFRRCSGKKWVKALSGLSRSAWTSIPASLSEYILFHGLEFIAGDFAPGIAFL